jgi:diguanylate cyclase (GGDEF)-like protein
MTESRKSGLGSKGRLSVNLDKDLNSIEPFEAPKAVEAARRINSEIEDLKDESEHQKYAATHDELTGLPNRKYFTEALNDQLVTNPGKFALIFMDLDKFKERNDSLGHEGGDQLLINAAKIASQSVRQEDTGRRPTDIMARFVARLGGDEFVFLLPSVDSHRVVDDIAARIQNNLAEHDISASLGGRVHRPGETAGEFLTAIDQLMYADKESRR